MTSPNLEDIKISIKIKLSALWVTLMLCYIYADILGFYQPGEIAEILEGRMGPFPVTQTALFTSAILMVIPASMVFLSLALKPKVNRLTNIIVGVVYALISLGNIIGETWAYYIGFGIIEIVLTLMIIWCACKWPKMI